MKKLYVLLVLVFISSCSNKYGVMVSGGQTTYTEEGEATSSFTGTTLTLPKYSSKGRTLSAGITEESDWFLTKLSYFQTSYSNVEYVVSLVPFSTDLEESGVSLSLGLKLWIFQPFLLMSSTNGEYEINGVSKKENYSSFGYGLDIEVPITKSAFWFLGYSIQETENVSMESGVALTQRLGHQSLYSGIRFNIFDLSKGRK